ncbi:DNA repair protein RecO [Sediminibacterium ginsengisoli]|uniref:DNA repair protein RecO n=1 Tax=Sediminibacterium ginsengisoli TaxID=413434 RepID=A0A1T4RI82_9BACT|nr:DNA repair protein RecO [Sediminibacterium ginsengisoli]SKA15458.1 DNA replication and repair protein RecO [Sediminibacterium ginsengisoli]
MVHTTKGIVLRTVKYGDTSIIATLYTELFGIQSYMVKGVRKSTRTSAGKAGYFQPAAILDMEVYHNEQKQLQFIKNFEWGYLYENLLFDVKKNAVSMYVIELLQHTLKQPEANPELFYLIEDTLKQLDKGSDTLSANLPLYFILHLGSELGFRMQGTYHRDTPILDLQEGVFMHEKPLHPYFLDGSQAEITSQLLALHFYNDLERIALNRHMRRELLEAYHSYLALHISDFGEMKSLSILQEVLS